MAKILNIDTSSNICSVALAADGEIIVGYESATKMDHSTSLAPFIEKCLSYLRERKENLDAVAVTGGPGSYTGLRIGLSMAKGLCFGFNIPLISISSLLVMAVRAIFTYPSFKGEELIVPMMDARRMEVYTGVYNSLLENVKPESAVILDESTFSDLDKSKEIIFIGDGTEKFKTLFSNKNAIWLGNGMAHAKYMAAIAEKFYKEKKNSDVAYTIPSYLKEYQATEPKRRL